MNEANPTLAALNAAYERWAGTPTTILELRRGELNEQIPTELNILFFQPEPEDNLSEEEYFTYIATAGMSTHVMQGPCKHAELILCVQRLQPPEALETLGRRIAELAVIPFREDTYFAPNLLLSGVSLPLFEPMNCVLITNWGVNSPEWLPGIQPPVQLLSVKPVYESEAEIIKVIGDIEACSRFINEGVNWDDPKRDSAYLIETTS
ncbi:suppressor of fused domain protein [Aerosakkonemataceae cyanobacterium BLCC-F50]|uniref:Suppressor of fused domain protein n=1 Tax=Floridaenema flaviceps BLCC-F50 TaxID=3153642 RepID=A0ABV4XJ93_9CYAN